MDIVDLGAGGFQRADVGVDLVGERGGEHGVDACELGVTIAAGELGDADVEGAVVAIAGDF